MGHIMVMTGSGGPERRIRMTHWGMGMAGICKTLLVLVYY